MPQSRELRSVLDAAEHAAAAGDFAVAEQHLREAAVQQEASLGPLHPDLANTLNNLGIVYERLDKPADAERCFRRAYGIATAALEPDHPFVAMSSNNLRDFCAARGRPFQLPATPVVPPPVVPSPVAPPLVFPPPAVPAASAIRKQSRSRWTGLLGVAALLLVMLMAGRLWFSASRESVAQPPIESPPPVVESPPGKPVPVNPATAGNLERPTKGEPGRGPARSASPLPIVVSATLCGDLSTGDWRCEPASRPVDSGRLFFYSRITSPTNTAIQHRWYRGDRLHQAVQLDIQANQGGGYRTYSRTTVNGEPASDWRIEIRTKEGALLHEERFVVR